MISKSKINRLIVSLHEEDAIERAKRYTRSGLRELDLYNSLKHGIKLCCIIFYEYAWEGGSIRNDNPSYASTMNIMGSNGIVLCPACLIKKLKKYGMYKTDFVILP